jgi:hypothetical protein
MIPTITIKAEVDGKFFYRVHFEGRSDGLDATWQRSFNAPLSDEQIIKIANKEMQKSERYLKRVDDELARRFGR